MITVKRVRVSYEEITDRDFYQWLKETYENVGDELNDMEAIRFYLGEDWEGTNRASGWSCDTKVEVLGLTDKQALAMIKKVAKEYAEEYDEEDED